MAVTLTPAQFAVLAEAFERHSEEREIEALDLECIGPTAPHRVDGELDAVFVSREGSRSIHVAQDGTQIGS